MFVCAPIKVNNGRRTLAHLLEGDFYDVLQFTKLMTWRDLRFAGRRGLTGGGYF